MLSLDELGACLANVRKKAPLIHCITNYVTINDVANMILAAGASPIMANEEAEVEEITAIADGLCINMGMLTKMTIPSMLRAGKRANELSHPVVLDPVGAGASRLRTETAVKLLNEVHFAAIRGNISEIKTLMEGTGHPSGVDAGSQDAMSVSELERTAGMLMAFAEKLDTVIVVTGKTDMVCSARECYLIANGHNAMSRVTGTGCQLSGLLAAFLTANPESPLAAAVSAVCTMGIAGETGWRYLKPEEGNASYRTRMIDAVYRMEPEKLKKDARYRILQ